MSLKVRSGTSISGRGNSKHESLRWECGEPEEEWRKSSLKGSLAHVRKGFLGDGKDLGESMELLERGKLMKLIRFFLLYR